MHDAVWSSFSHSFALHFLHLVDLEVLVPQEHTLPMHMALSDKIKNWFCFKFWDIKWPISGDFSIQKLNFNWIKNISNEELSNFSVDY